MATKIEQKLWQEHCAEAKRKGAEFHNYGWATSTNGIASKTSKGILDSEINPRTKVVRHEWS